MGNETIGHSAIYQYIGSLSVILGGAIFYIFLIETLTQSEVGSVTLLSTILGLFSVILTIGIGPGIQHFVSYHMARNEYLAVSQILKRVTALSILLGAFSSIAIYLLSPGIVFLFYRSDQMSYASTLALVRLLGLVSVFYVINGILSNCLLGLQKFRLTGIILSLGSLIIYGLPIFLVLLYGNIDFIVLAWSFAYGVVSVVYISFIIRAVTGLKAGTGAPFDFSLLVRYSIPVFVSSLISYGAAYADRLLVAFLTNTATVAVYNLALLMSTTVAFFIAPVNNISLPKLSEFLSISGKDAILRGVNIASSVVSFLYFPVAMIVASLSPLIIAIIRPDYESAYPAVMIIMVSTSVFVTQNVLTRAISSVRLTNVLVFASAFSFVSNAILSILLIPRLGIVGASLGYASVFVTSFFVLYYFSRKSGIVAFDMGTLSKIALAGSLTFAMGIFLELFVFPGVITAADAGLIDKLHSLEILAVMSLVSLGTYIAVIRYTATFKLTDMDFIFSLLPRYLNRFKSLATRVLVRDRSVLALVEQQ